MVTQVKSLKPELPDLAFFSHFVFYKASDTNLFQSVNPVMNNIRRSIVTVDLFRPKFGCMITNSVWHIGYASGRHVSSEGFEVDAKLINFPQSINNTKILIVQDQIMFVNTKLSFLLPIYLYICTCVCV